METLPLTPDQRLHGIRTYGRVARNLDTVAWRAPGAMRFESRPANDLHVHRDAAGPGLSDIPHWMILVVGAVAAAVVGALLGGMLAV